MFASSLLDFCSPCSQLVAHVPSTDTHVADAACLGTQQVSAGFAVAPEFMLIFLHSLLCASVPFISPVPQLALHVPLAVVHIFLVASSRISG